MDKKYQTMKLWKSTLRNLRLIYASTGEPQVSILDRLITQELKRLKDDSTPTETQAKR
jgi:hypothetical protein